MKLHIDIETYSSVDIKSSGVYKYCESPDFEILLIAYAIDQGSPQILDLTTTPLPPILLQTLLDPRITKCAHNASFERTAFKAIGIDIPVEQWECSMVKAAYCGLPLSLDNISEVLSLGDKGKLRTGRALIRKFCCPVKPTMSNGLRYRNAPKTHPGDWEQFKEYCLNDVRAEQTITSMLSKYPTPPTERRLYCVDQAINDRGVLIDEQFVQNACDFKDRHKEFLFAQMKRITGLANPGSAAQLKAWLGKAMNKTITTLAKDEIPKLIAEAEAASAFNEQTAASMVWSAPIVPCMPAAFTAAQVLTLRTQASKSSAEKYDAMLSCLGDDSRVRGLHQFYGAGRTGRWAGRLIQTQNIVRNTMKELHVARAMVRNSQFDAFILSYGDPAAVLSELIRTGFVASPGKTLAVSDFSAIEARVIAWLAGEKWRLDVFKTHGKIYEASASAMFGIPIESIDEDSPYRQKGKVAELALGYQGAVGAMKTMGGARMGLSEAEMKDIVERWRAKSPRIKALWRTIEQAALYCVRTRTTTSYPLPGSKEKIFFRYDGTVLMITLPSKRSLFYWKPKLVVVSYDRDSLQYQGMNQLTRKWESIDTYGGKLVENIVQAIARDLLADAMLQLEDKGYSTVMHIHDEVVCEVPLETADQNLEVMTVIMSTAPAWAQGLPLAAKGYVTPFYKKG